MKVRLLCALALSAAIAMPAVAADAVSHATGKIPRRRHDFRRDA